MHNADVSTCDRVASIMILSDLIDGQKVKGKYVPVKTKREFFFVGRFFRVFD